jgi:2-iminobutanoate/2-iminopropanoate deaminase
MARKAIVVADMFAAGPYAHAVETNGTVFLSGKTGTDSQGKLVEGGVGPETEATFANLKTVLGAAGLTYDHVVKCNVYLTNMADFAAMNAIYSAQFSQPYPARTTVAVVALPGGAKVEIEMVAER